jgi:hypothetical protein
MLAPVVLAADYADTIQLTDRLDVRARATHTVAGQTAVPPQTTLPAQPAQPAVVNPVSQPPCGTNGTAPCVQAGLDLANQASAIFNARTRRWQFSLVYSPVLTLTDVEKGINAQNEPQLFQTASGAAAWHARFTRIALSETLSYGHFNSAYLFQPGAPSATSSPGQVAPVMTTPGGAATSTTQLVPRPQDVYYGSTATSLTLTEAIGRRSTFSLGGGYIAAGGLDEASRNASPLAYGPRADASFGYALSRSLRTVTMAHAELTDLTASQCYSADGVALPSLQCRPENELAVLSQGLRDSITRATSLSVDGGIAYARFRTDVGLPFNGNLYPEVAATVTHTYGSRGLETLIVSAQLTPLVDVRTGQITYGAQGAVTLIDTLSPIVTISVDAAGGQTIFPADDPLASSLVRSDFEARFRTDRYGRVILLLGESELWQNQHSLGGFLSIYGYFAVTVATPALRF